LIFRWGKIWRALFGIRPREVTFARRGFRAENIAAQRHLEQVGRTFLDGYHAALEEEQQGRLLARLDTVGQESRGFAFEGAAMALCLLDHLIPGRRNRLSTFLNGPGRNHAYMVHVGVGGAAARLGGPLARWRKPLDPLLCWLAVDGHGFHEGYFHWHRFVAGGPVPPRLVGYECRVFDQGLGRSLWFVCGADVDTLAGVIARFSPRRRPDLWSGAGLACAYAGGVDGKVIRLMAEASDLHRAHVAQGVAFAAKARERAGNPTDHTEQVCRVICGLSAHDAARITDAALESLVPEGPDPAYEVWRRRIQRSFSSSRVVALVGNAGDHEGGPGE
jgi:enediyne biosynthesis protein E3